MKLRQMILVLGILLLSFGSSRGEPIEVICQAEKDAMVYSNAPGMNFGHEYDFAVGPVSYMNDWMYESYLQFDLSAIPSGAQIVEAKFEFYCYDNNIGSYCKDLEVYPVRDTPWDEYTITWNNKPNFYNFSCYPDEMELCPGYEGWYIISDNCTPPCDCEQIVQAWVNYRDQGGSWPTACPNYGVNFGGIANWEENDGAAYFYSHEASNPDRHPRLRVVYDSEPPKRIYGWVVNEVEPGICVSSITVRLGGATTTVTDGDGYFEFTGLLPGDYRVCVDNEGCVKDWWFSDGQCRDITIGDTDVEVSFEATAPAVTIEGTDKVIDSDINCASGHENDNWCENTSLRIGDYRSSLIRFDIDDIPSGKIILDADVSLFCAGQMGGGGVTVELRRITGDWGECTVNCNNAPGYLAPVATDDFQLGERHYIQIGDLVRDWNSGTEDNYGLYLRAQDYPASGHYVSYSSSEVGNNQRPFLKVALQDKPKWTILVYMCADNTLEQFAMQDLNEMEEIGSSSDVKLIVQVDGRDGTYLPFADTRMYYITQDSDPSTIGSVRLDDGDPLDPLGEVDMGDYHEIIEFAEWGFRNYPAEHYALILWDHGNGWYKGVEESTFVEPFKTFCNDDNPNPGSHIDISDGDWENALVQIQSQLKRNIDLVGFDACLMQMWEVLDITDDYADYMVGSEAKEFANGWAYDEFLSVLVANPSLNAQDLGLIIVDAAIDGSGQRTQSSVQLNHVSTLTTAVDNLANELITAMENATYQTLISNIRVDLRSDCHEYDVNDNGICDDHHVDLYELASRLHNAAELPAELRNAAEAVTDAVSYAVSWNRTSPSYDWSEGIAIYYPYTPASYDYTYENLPVSESTMWNEFISGRVIVVSEPAEGDIWQIGSTHNIVWSDPFMGVYQIDYSTDIGVTWKPIVDIWSSGSPYPWQIPDDPSTQCRIRICEVDGDPCGLSSGNFTIPEQVITIQFPDGGEILKAGECYEITWTTSMGAVGDVRIDLSTDGGNSWIDPPIVESAPNTGSYDWCISNLTLSTNCRIRVCEADGSPCDMSDGDFTSASIMVLRPNDPGIRLYVSRSYRIEWSTLPEGSVGNVAIEYSTNGGANWITIEEEIANQSEYLWTPIPNTPSTLCYVKVSAVNGDPWDRSNNYFAIVALDHIGIEGPQTVSENSSVQYQCLAYYTDGGQETVDPCNVIWGDGCAGGDIDACGLFTTGEVTQNEECQITASFTDGDITETTNMDITIEDTQPCEDPVHFVVPASTGDSYSIVIDSAFLDALELEKCDEIGVFDDTGGGLLCVGASVYYPDSPPLPLIAWKDDPLTPQKDGYTAGDTMYFRVWSKNQDREECALSDFKGAEDGTFEWDLFSQLWLEAPCIYELPLHSGWQWVSTNIDPDPCEMESLFADCWDDLGIIIACDGSFCIPGVGCWIDCWNVLEMYKLHMAAMPAQFRFVVPRFPQIPRFPCLVVGTVLLIFRSVHWSLKLL
ncbi:MAG: DNRLRE domain-containing protein [candidate division Zixibacteria bacterium]|nr:DNRLRE domain-containing protein [candidate division Zixibacteria bacterium]